MTDAPERIWIAPWREGDWSEGDWDDNEGKTLNDKPCIQYVRADRIEALTEQLAAARKDAKAAEDELEMQEQEACMMENDYIKLEKERDALEAKLATCEKYRDAYDEMGRIGTQAVRDIEAKLARAEWLLTDAAVQLEEGKIKTRRNRAGLIWQFLAEIKGESRD